MKTGNAYRKRVISFMMLLAYVIALPFGFLTEANADGTSVSTSYKSSDYFSESSVSNGPWTNQYYDFISAADNDKCAYYLDMVATKNRGELDGSSVVWQNSIEKDPYNWGNKAVFVGAKYMRASVATGSDEVVNTWWEANVSKPGRNYPVKTFIAPEAGEVTVKAAENLTIIGTGTHIRIMKIADGMEKSSQVWPESGWQLITGEYTFTEFNTTINAGEKLTFECAYINDGNSSADTVLAWDPIVEYTEDPATENPEPVNENASSYYFSTESVSNGPWSNQFYDVMTAGLGNGGITLVSGYVDMTATKERGELEGTPTVWASSVANDEYTWGNKAAFVGADVMKTSTGATNWTTYNGAFEDAGWTGRNYPVKTFTALENGYIKISAATALTATANGTNIRITKFRTTDSNPTNVWPTDTTWKHILGEYTFEDITLEVEAGDKIAFENAYIKDTELGNTADDTLLYWDPVVEYTDAPVADEPEEVVSYSYKASEYFSASSNPNGPWAAMYYDYDAGGTQRSCYKNMEYIKEGEWINHDPTVTTGNYQWGNNSARIGLKKMCADTYGNATDDEKNSVVGRDYPVRAFTAPNNGTVVIKSDIFTERDNGAHLRIMKFGPADTKGTQIWPVEGWENVTPGYVFEDITLDVKIGDMITFENAFIWTKDGESPWDTLIDWDPTVEYEKIYPILQTVNPENESINVALNYVHTLTFDKDVNSIGVTDVMVKEEANRGSFVASQAVCSSANTVDDTITLTFSGLKEYKKYEITVGGIGYATCDASWVNSEKYIFTTGSSVDLKPATYDVSSKTVSVQINNSKAEYVSADMLVFVCDGTESSYTVINTFILQRDDIGANDTMQISGVEIPAGNFIKVIILKDILTATPYGETTILGGE